VHMIKLTETREITSYVKCIQMKSGETRPWDIKLSVTKNGYTKIEAASVGGLFRS
jgi:hypothetical protein